MLLPRPRSALSFPVDPNLEDCTPTFRTNEYQCSSSAPGHSQGSVPAQVAGVETPIQFSSRIVGGYHYHHYPTTLVPSVAPSIYPSPPSTSSDPKYPVPLPQIPNLVGDTTNYHDKLNDSRQLSCFQSASFGGILDSPLVMHHVLLEANMPPSPPPTQPTPTLELPIDTSEQQFAGKGDRPHAPRSNDGSSASTTPPLSPSLSSVSSPALSESLHTPVSSCSSEGYDSPGDIPLSPLSPEWASGMSSDKDPETSYISSNSPPQFVSSQFFDSPLSQGLELEAGFGDDYLGFPVVDDSRPSSSALAKPFLPLLDIPSSASSSSRALSDIYTPSISPSPWEVGIDDGSLLASDSLDQENAPLTSPPSLDPPQIPPPESLYPDLPGSSEHPQNLPDTLSYSYFPHPSSPSIRTFDLFPEADDDAHFLALSRSSPHLRGFSPLPDFSSLDEKQEPSVFFDVSSPASSSPNPSDVYHPSDATVDSDPWSIKSEELSPSPTASSQYANNSLLLLLDEDPTNIVPRSPSPDNFTVDPTAIADLPEHDEVQQLLELRRRAQLAEKQAKKREQAAMMEINTLAQHPADQTFENTDESITITGMGSWELQCVATDARRVARREREKAREVSALLRLKLDKMGINVDSPMDAVPVSTSRSPPSAPESPSSSSLGLPLPLPPDAETQTLFFLSTPTSPSQYLTSTKKGTSTSSVAQLVAKMILNRRNSPSDRPPSKFRPVWLRGPSPSTASATQHQTYLQYQQRYSFLRSSPLARSGVSRALSSSSSSSDEWHGGDVEDESESEDNEGGFEALKTPLTWGMDLEDEASGMGLLPAL